MKTRLGAGFVVVVLGLGFSVPAEAKALGKKFYQGYSDFKKREYQRSVKVLSSITSQDYILKDYIDYALGDSLLHLKRCHEALEPLNRVVRLTPPSRWHDLAIGKLAFAALCLEEPSLVEKTVGDLLKADVDNEVKATVLSERAEMFFRQGKPQEANDDLETILESYPDASIFEKTLGLFKERGAQSDHYQESLTQARLAETLVKRGHCERAATLWKGSAPTRNSLRQLAECFFSTKRYDRAKDFYRQWCRSEGTVECMAHLAQSAARSNDADLAIETNRVLIQKFPKSREAQQAEVKIPFIYEDSGQYAQAIPFLEKWHQAAKTRVPRERLMERLLWAYYQTQRYEKALALADEASSYFSFNGFFDYWRGRTLEQMGKMRDARDVYSQLSVRLPFTYYALRALERLYPGKEPVQFLKSWWGRRGVPHWVSEEVSAEPDSGEPDSQILQKVRELYKLGLIDDARVELRRYRYDHDDCNHYDPALRHRWIDNQDKTFLLPHGEILFPFAQELGMDPYFVYAMMRQESRFKEGARSPAGALGLMQLMPATARRVARESGWDYFKTDQVTDPEINIRLGMEYLRILGRYFNEPLYKVASYNAGEEAVKRWQSSRQDASLDEFIEEIPYEETRDYVKQVYLNWQAYRFIYGAQH